MIIEELKKEKNGLYSIKINQEIYSLSEESVLKYRLFKGNEISETDLQECVALDDLFKIKKRAYSYFLRYCKNSYEVLNYLTDKEIPYSLAKQAVDSLKTEGLIDDFLLAKSIATGLASASNGPYLIRYKLKGRHFEEDVVEKAIANLTEEDYKNGKEKLMKKIEKRYKDLSNFDKNRKMKEILYRHGYENF